MAFYSLNNRGDEITTSNDHNQINSMIFDFEKNSSVISSFISKEDQINRPDRPCPSMRNKTKKVFLKENLLSILI